MKSSRLTLSILCICTLFSEIYGQYNLEALEKTKQQITCGTSSFHNRLYEHNAIFKSNIDQLNEKIVLHSTLKSTRGLDDCTKKYTIPIVFHLFSSQNNLITQLQITSQLDRLNHEFNGNLLPTPIHSPNSCISFCFAKWKNGTLGDTLSPILNGEYGIVRYTQPTFNQINQDNFNQLNDLNTLINNQFPSQRYLNIVIVDEITNSQGTSGIGAFSSLGMGAPFDGILIRADILGDETTSSYDGVALINGYNKGYALVHEIGHYLGLYHTFEHNGTCETNPTTQGDRCPDTAPILNPTLSCNGSQAPCSGTVQFELGNHMDYTEDQCKTHFTINQIERMHGVLNIYRHQLWQMENLILTGVADIYNTQTSCIEPAIDATISINKSTFCSGIDVINITSFPIEVATYTYTIYDQNGIIVVTDSQYNSIPILTAGPFSNPGDYTITLEITDSTYATSYQTSNVTFHVKDCIGSESSFVKTLVNDSIYSGMSITVSHDENAYLIAGTIVNHNVDSTEISESIVVLKLNLIGDVIWQKTYEKPGYQRCTNIEKASNTSSNYLLTGYEKINGKHHALYMVINELGEVMHTSSFIDQSGLSSVGLQVIPNQAGNVMMVGIVSDQYYLEHGQLEGVKTSMFIAELEVNGNVIWQKYIDSDSLDLSSLGKVDNDIAEGILEINHGQNTYYYITGRLNNTVNLSVSQKNNSILLDEEGNVIWFNTLNGHTNDADVGQVYFSTDAIYHASTNAIWTTVNSSYYHGFSLLEIDLQSGNLKNQFDYGNFAEIYDNIFADVILPHPDGSLVVFGKVNKINSSLSLPFALKINPNTGIGEGGVIETTNLQLQESRFTNRTEIYNQQNSVNAPNGGYATVNVVKNDFNSSTNIQLITYDSNLETNCLISSTIPTQSNLTYIEKPIAYQVRYGQLSNLTSSLISQEIEMSCYTSCLKLQSHILNYFSCSTEDNVILNPTNSLDDLVFEWSPQLYLDDPYSPTPSVIGLPYGESVIYTLTAFCNGNTILFKEIFSVNNTPNSMVISHNQPNVSNVFHTNQNPLIFSTNSTSDVEWKINNQVYNSANNTLFFNSLHWGTGIHTITASSLNGCQTIQIQLTESNFIELTSQDCHTISAKALGHFTGEITWDFGDGTIYNSGNSTSVNHTYTPNANSPTTSYTLSLYEDGILIGTKNVSMYNTYYGLNIPTQLDVIQGANITLPIINSASDVWTDINTQFIFFPGASFSPSQSTTLELETIDTYGCPYNHSMQINIITNFNPNDTLNCTNNIEIASINTVNYCSSNGAELSIPAGNYFIEWLYEDFNGDLIPFSNLHQVLVSTNYPTANTGYFTVKTTDAVTPFCSAIAHIFIDVQDIEPTAHFEINSMCQALKVEANFNCLATYRWDMGNGDIFIGTGYGNEQLNYPSTIPGFISGSLASFTYTYPPVQQETTYTITLTLNGTISYSSQITIQPSAIHLGNDMTIQSGETVSLNYPGNGQFYWSDGTNILNQHTQTIQVSPTSTTTYTLIEYNVDLMNNTFCVEIGQVTVSVDSTIQCHMETSYMIDSVNCKALNTTSVSNHPYDNQGYWVLTSITNDTVYGSSDSYSDFDLHGFQNGTYLLCLRTRVSKNDSIPPLCFDFFCDTIQLNCQNINENDAAICLTIGDTLFSNITNNYIIPNTTENGRPVYYINFNTNTPQAKIRWNQVLIRWEIIILSNNTSVGFLSLGDIPYPIGNQTDWIMLNGINYAIQTLNENCAEPICFEGLDLNSGNIYRHTLDPTFVENGKIGYYLSLNGSNPDLKISWNSSTNRWEAVSYSTGVMVAYLNSSNLEYPVGIHTEWIMTHGFDYELTTTLGYCLTPICFTGTDTLSNTIHTENIISTFIENGKPGYHIHDNQSNIVAKIIWSNTSSRWEINSPNNSITIGYLNSTNVSQPIGEQSDWIILNGFPYQVTTSETPCPCSIEASFDLIKNDCEINLINSSNLTDVNSVEYHWSITDINGNESYSNALSSSNTFNTSIVLDSLNLPNAYKVCLVVIGNGKECRSGACKTFKSLPCSNSPCQQPPCFDLGVINLFPNPANQAINLTGISQAKVIELIDALGKVNLIKKIEKSVNDCIIDVSTLSPGIYFVKISLQNDATEIIKLIIR